jgi:hypothetical protein
MGNLVNTFIGGLLIYYIKVKNKLTGSSADEHTDSLLHEEKKEDDSILNLKKDDTMRNEYQLLKSNEDCEFLKEKQDNQLIEEMSKEIKNVNIEFDQQEIEDDKKQIETNEDNLDELKMQILSEHEDN